MGVAFLMWVCHIFYWQCATFTYPSLPVGATCIRQTNFIFRNIQSGVCIPFVCTLFELYIWPIAACGKSGGENEEVSVKAVCAFVKRMRKRKEISLICCEPGVSSPKPQNWQPIITNVCLIRQMIHVPQMMTQSCSAYSMITRFLLGKVWLNTGCVTPHLSVIIIGKNSIYRRLVSNHATTSCDVCIWYMWINSVTLSFGVATS